MRDVMRESRLRVAACAAIAIAMLAPAPLAAQARAGRAPTHGVRRPSLVIRNATIVDGNGTPASGPADILIENDRIARVVFLDPVAVSSGTARRPEAETEIDATGKFVLPGLINAHAHLQDERARVPQPY